MKFIVTLSLVVSFIISVVIIVNQRNSLNELEVAFDRQTYYLDQAVFNKETLVNKASNKWRIQSEFEFIPSLKYIDSNREVNLNEVVSDYKGLVAFRIFSVNCKKCILENFRKLKSAVPEYQIVLLTDDQNTRALSILKSDLDLNENQRVYYCRKLFASEQPQDPYFFLIEPAGQMSSCFIPDDDMPEITDAYLEFVKSSIL